MTRKSSTSRNTKARTAAPNPEAAPAVKKQERVISPAEAAARARGFKGSQELREQFGINEEYQREIVVVAELPDPPATQPVEAAANRTSPAIQKVNNLDEVVLRILQEEADEVSVRLQRFGVSFGPHLQQAMVDHCFSMLALNSQGFAAAGGAISGH